jgi:hypothetical protein
MTSIEALQKTVESLERRLRVTEDIAAIQRLKARYGRLADARYDRRGVVAAERLVELADEVAELFTEDAVWDAGKPLGVARGRDEIRARFRAPSLQFSWHYFVKPEIDVEGDRARGRWDILAPCTSTEGRALWMAGYEDDEYERVDGVWLHSAMKLGVVFMAPHDRGWAPAKPPAG